MFRVEWSVRGTGFGEFSFYTENGVLKIDNESMGRGFIKKVLGMLVDSATLTEDRGGETMSDEKKDLTPEFLAAADVEADTPIAIRPTVDPEDIRLAREAYARGEGIDAGDVLAELARENQEWGMYDNPPGPRTGEK